MARDLHEGNRIGAGDSEKQPCRLARDRPRVAADHVDLHAARFDARHGLARRFVADGGEVHGRERLVQRLAFRDKRRAALHAQHEGAVHGFDARLVHRRDAKMEIAGEHVENLRMARDDDATADAEGTAPGGREPGAQARRELRQGLAGEGCGQAATLTWRRDDVGGRAGLCA